MGRKSVPFVDESALLKLRLRDALDDHAELSLTDAGDEDSDEFGFMTSSQPGTPADLTLEDLYCRNRNRARLVGLMHAHRACEGAQIIVVASGGQTPERDDLYEDDAMSWFVKPIEQDRLVHAALRLVH
jgi:response regulator of citrate/malate metabolism